MAMSHRARAVAGTSCNLARDSMVSLSEASVPLRSKCEGHGLSIFLFLLVPSWPNWEWESTPTLQINVSYLEIICTNRQVSSHTSIHPRCVFSTLEIRVSPPPEASPASRRGCPRSKSGSMLFRLTPGPQVFGVFGDPSHQSFNYGGLTCLVASTTRRPRPEWSP